jgi:hypothetical protein
VVSVKKKVMFSAILTLLLIVSFVGLMQYVNTSIFGYKETEINIIDRIGLITNAKQLREIPKDNYTEVKFAIVNSTFEDQKIQLIAKDYNGSFEMNLPLITYIAEINGINFLLGLDSNADTLEVGDTIDIRYKGSVK